MINYDKVLHNRSIYSALDWLGDVGGLMDALAMLFQILVGLFYADVFRFHLVASFFKHQVSGKPEVNSEASMVVPALIKQR